MPYNSVTTRANAAGLIPPQYSQEMATGTTESSAVLRLAKRLTDIPAGIKTMPVLSALPFAYFVTGDNSTKQTTQITWANKNVTAEELAVIVPIPQAVYDDMASSGFAFWDSAKPYITEAMGIAIDQAVLYGVNIPASWITDIGSATGILGLCGAASPSHSISLAARVDLYDALMADDAVLGTLEQNGYIASGWIGHTSLKGKLRNTRNADGDPIFKPGANAQNGAFATGELDGAPILYPLNGAIDSSKSLAFAGQWNQLVYGMRQDISYSFSDQGVIQDGAGNIVFNLFQQDMIAMRIVMRLGFSLPNPINRMQATQANRVPFSVLTA
jgi:HK97 family phage major capsid protein